MDEVIKALSSLLPFDSWFEKLGIPEPKSDYLSVVLTALLVSLLWWTGKKLLHRWKNRHAAKNLYPQFDYKALQQATRIYIPTQYQNASPAPGDTSRVC